METRGAAAGQRLRILTFNHHESYVAALAGLDYDFDVVVRYGQLGLPWNQSSRRPPANVRLVEFDAEVRADLHACRYDAVICHTVKNLLWLFRYRAVPYVFIAHIPLYRHSLALALKSTVKRGLFLLFSRTRRRVRFMAVSEFKRNAWNIAGPVVVLTPGQVTSSTLESPAGCADAAATPIAPVVVVCNQLLQRQDELGYPILQELVARGIPVAVIGRNPGVPEGVQPSSHQEFLQLFRQGRIYLYTIRQPYGDGYNTAMLEAMALGMPVVTVGNPSSPIEHGVQGFVGDTVAELELHLRTLLADAALCERMGLAARRLIDESFSKERFLTGWRAIVEQAARR